MREDLLKNCNVPNKTYLLSLPEPVQDVISQISSSIRGFFGSDYNTINKIIIPTLIRRSKLPDELVNLLFSNLDEKVIQQRERMNRRSAILPFIPSSQLLTEVFTQVETELLVEWSIYQDKTPSVYHLDGHGDEMATDSKSFAKKEADRLFPGTTKESIRACFCAFSKMVHATHDLIQDLGPIDNEIATYEIVRDRTKLRLEEAGIKEGHNSLLFAAIDHAIWETIAVGTTFNFAEQVPILYYINRINSSLAAEEQFKCPLFIAAIQLSIAINDTRRCSQLRVIIPEYDPAVIFLHMKHCKGRENHFLRFAEVDQLSDTAADSEFHFSYLQMAHLFGQNIRAKLELILKNMNIEKLTFLCSLLGQVAHDDDDVSNKLLFNKIKRFCLYLKKYLIACSDNSYPPIITEENLIEYFDFFVAMMRKEVDFAKGFSGEKLAHLITLHHKLLNLDNVAYDMSNLNEWEMYAVTLEKYLDSISSSELNTLQKKSILHDCLLLGANQIGNFSISFREDYSSLLANKSRDGDADLIYREKYLQFGRKVIAQQQAIRELYNGPFVMDLSDHTAFAQIVKGIPNPTDNTPWIYISKALSTRLTTIEQSFMLGKKMQEAASIFLSVSDPMIVWLTNNIHNIHSRDTLLTLMRSISRANSPSLLSRYVCCCFYQRSIMRQNSIQNALESIITAKDITQVLSSLDTLNKIARPSSSAQIKLPASDTPGVVDDFRTAEKIDTPDRRSYALIEDDPHERVIIATSKLQLK